MDGVIRDVLVAKMLETNDEKIEDTPSHQPRHLVYEMRSNALDPNVTAWRMIQAYAHIRAI